MTEAQKLQAWSDKAEELLRKVTACDSGPCPTYVGLKEARSCISCPDCWEKAIDKEKRRILK